MIVFISLYFIPGLGGFAGLETKIAAKNLSLSLWPSSAHKNWLDVFSLAAGWGLGYFGQPHVVTKFMGIKNVSEMSKSKWVGMSWMLIALSAATLIGLVGIGVFPEALSNPEHIFIQLVTSHFSSFFIGLILCAVMAATMNQTSSQILVLTSTLAEDFYKKIFRKTASSSELLLVSRLGVILISAFAFLIAFGKVSSIYSLVLYAWSGLGASFGPLLLFCLYSKTINKYGAWSGILVGGITSALWPYFHPFSPIELAPLIPGFILSCLSIMVVSYATRPKKDPL